MLLSDVAFGQGRLGVQGRKKRLGKIFHSKESVKNIICTWFMFIIFQMLYSTVKIVENIICTWVILMMFHMLSVKYVHIEYSQYSVQPSCSGTHNVL